MGRHPRLASQGRILRVGYVLSYYFPQYVRTKTLLDGLKGLRGVQVLEAINPQPGPWRYLESLLRLLWIRLRYNPDCYILGFRGTEIFWPVRLLTLGRPLIVDYMMSPYDSLLNESGRLKAGSVLARLMYGYERRLLRAADTILTDTQLHRDYLSCLFQIPRDKIRAVPVGADESLFRRDVQTPVSEDGTFTVLFYGSFLPLHGIDVILDAAETLKELPVRFVLIGGNRLDLSDFHRKLHRRALTNVEHLPWVDYRELPEWIARADLCLGGPFGGTGQARRVVTGKTYQCMAMAKPTVVGAIEEEMGFVDRLNCLLVPQRAPQALAASIRWAYDHRGQLPEIGYAGYRLYCDRFSCDVIGGILDRVLGSLVFDHK